MCINNPGHMSKNGPPLSYMVKTHQKSNSSEQVDQFQQNLACSIVD